MYSEDCQRKLFQAWPQDGGGLVQPFVHNYRKAHGCYQGSRFSNVMLYNMHQDGHLMTNFVNQVLPGATNAFDIGRHGKKSQPSRPNPSMSNYFDFDMLVVEAREEGLVGKDKRLSRQAVSKTIRKAIVNHNSYNTATRLCLTESEQKQLLEVSLLYERRLFPSLEADGMPIQHEYAFH